MSQAAVTDNAKPDDSWGKEELLAHITQLNIQLDKERKQSKDLDSQVQKLKEAAINIQRQSEFEEEYIVNSLVKRVSVLKREKEELEREVENEESYLTNTLQNRLETVRHEKVDLEKRLEMEQDFIVNHLQKQLATVIEEKTRLQQRLNRELVSEKNEKSSSSISASESESEKEDGSEKSKRLPIYKSEPILRSSAVNGQSPTFEHLTKAVDMLRRDLRKARHEIEYQKNALHKANDDKVLLGMKLKRLMSKFGEPESPRFHKMLQGTFSDEEMRRILSDVAAMREGSFSTPIMIPSNGNKVVRSKGELASPRNSDVSSTSARSSLGRSYTSPFGSPLGA